MLKLFATAPGGLSELLKQELLALGAAQLKVQPRGVAFAGDLTTAYRVCLWSRLANRVYLVLLEQTLDSQEHLLDVVTNLDWSQHLEASGYFAASFTGQGLGIDHTHFGALKIKDGIVDYFRNKTGIRPNIDIEAPDVRIHGHLNRKQFTLSLDLTGHSLHQRGYNQEQTSKTQLKENLAAALLIRSGWPEIAKQGGALYDPMCGSGTFLVEAAMIASDLAPGLLKANTMSLTTWLGHESKIWDELIEEATQREHDGLSQLPMLYGASTSQRGLDIATHTIAEAGYSDVVELKLVNVQQAQPWGDWSAGLVICHPPVVNRNHDATAVRDNFQQLGELLKQHFEGWQAAILACDKTLGMALGLKAKRKHQFFKGPTECTLFRFDVKQQWHRQAALAGGSDLASQVANAASELASTEGAIMFANRLTKNIKSLRKWRKQQHIQACRLYDADMPEYSVAIDQYDTQDAGIWVVVNEYAAPKTVNPAKAKRRLHEIMAVLPETLQITPQQIIYKVRERQRGDAQYERFDDYQRFSTIIEGNAKLQVNFTDYLDTGLFLDHRNVRNKVAELAQDKTLLNLFCYTATVTVQAALAGAKSSLSIDMSNTYLTWAERNFEINHIDQQAHKVLQTDVIQWLTQQSHQPDQKFDVIFLDPPSFSTSKRMQSTLDIQRDYISLVQQTLNLLTQHGILIFSTNKKGFKLDLQSFPEWQVDNITQATMPKDFAKNHKIHQVWLFTQAKQHS